MKALWLALLCGLIAGCQEPVFTGPLVLGGVSVSAEQLEQGRRVYGRYCLRCHGAEGDGKGMAAIGQWPPPRDFTTAKFKFAGIQDRGLPADAELERIIRQGLRGTTMQPWALRDSELNAVVQYIKTFSPEGKGFRSERLKVRAPAAAGDPFAGHQDKTRAIQMGEELYHVSFQCSACHPSYVNAEALAGYQVAMRPDAPFDSVPKWSENYLSVLLPPDFLRHPMRSVELDEAKGGLNHRVEDIYRSIAFGLQGPMPGYVHLGEDKVWAVAHYVKSIADLRESPAARELRDALRSAPIPKGAPSTPASSAPTPLQNEP